MTRKKSRLSYRPKTARRIKKSNFQTSEDGSENKLETQTAKGSASNRKKSAKAKQKDQIHEIQPPLFPVTFEELPEDLKVKVENLLTYLSDNGFESMMVVLNLSTQKASQHGSSYGKQFLEKAGGDMRIDFYNFCKELTRADKETTTSSGNTVKEMDKHDSGSIRKERNSAELTEMENFEAKDEFVEAISQSSMTDETDNQSETTDYEFSKGDDHKGAISNTLNLIDFLRSHVNSDLHRKQKQEDILQDYRTNSRCKTSDNCDKHLADNLSDLDCSEKLKRVIEASQHCVEEIQGRADMAVDLYDMKYTDITNFTLNNKECQLCGTTVELNDISSHMSCHRKRLETLRLETCTECQVILPKNYIKKHLCNVVQKALPDEVISVYRDLRNHVAYIEMNHYWHTFVERKCWHCNTLLTNPTHVKKHILHEHFHQYFCTMCDEEIKAYSQIGEHFMEHEISRDKYEAIQKFKDGENEPLQCPLCDKSFTHKRSLLRHYKMNHRSNVGGTIGCSLCKRRFVNENNLVKHMVVHTQRYVCKLEDCSASFTHSHLLDKHKLKYHRDYMNKFRPFLCGICGKGFLRKATLKSHTEWKHLKEESPVECDVCHRMVRNKYLLKDHYRMHTQNQQYICEKCGLVFKTNSGLYNHKMTQHTDQVKEKYSCKVCGNLYARRSYLLHHIVSTNHITVNQTLDNFKFYECDDCHKKFGTKQKYTRHVDSVHKKKPLCTCQYCGKTFTDKSNFKQHTSLHNRQQFTCEICKTTFRSQTALNKHTYKTHSVGSKPDKPSNMYDVKKIKTEVRNFSSNNSYKEIRVHLSKNTRKDPHETHTEFRDYRLDETRNQFRGHVTEDDVGGHCSKDNSYHQSIQTSTRLERYPSQHASDFAAISITERGGQTYTVLTASPRVSSTVTFTQWYGDKQGSK